MEQKTVSVVGVQLSSFPVSQVVSCVGFSWFLYQVSANEVQVSENAGVRDQYSGESDGAFTRFRWNALRQRMAEEESGAWGSVDTRDVIVRLTGQQTNHATSKLLTL